ncbi:MAG: hypothetical protein KY466_17430 [Gemmatimonadetes bacterium]|nr:hypothetical protein [Gemmatimonadota bacterium]
MGGLQRGAGSAASWLDKDIAKERPATLIGVVATRIRFDGRILRLTATGQHAWPDVHAALKAAMAQDAFVDQHSILVMDAHHALATPTADELRDIAGDLAGLAPRFVAVLLVTADDLRFKLARMLAAYAEHLGVEILVFRSPDAAESWVRAHPERPRQVR